MMTDLPKISRAEYPIRQARVRDLMKQEQLDLLLVYADDRHTYGAAYARYYGDLPVAFEPVLLLFTPERDPVLLTGPETEGYAREVGSIDEICVLKEFAAENEDYPFSVLHPLQGAVLARTDHMPKRIGLGGTAIMSADILEKIRSAFPDAQYIPMDAKLEPLRGIKSKSEIEVIRYAYRLACLGMEAALKAVRPGVTEREIAAEAEYVMRKNGAEGTGIDTILVSGPNTRHILGRTTLRTVQENDLVVITLAPRYMGYHGAIARCVFVGEPDPAALNAVKAMIRAQETCGRSLKPGAIGSEVEAMGREIMSEAGYGKNFLYSGLHSVGVIEFEPPILGPSSRTVIEPDMVISVDIPLFEAEGFGARTEDGYLITAQGPECLTDRIPRLIFR